MQTQDDETLKNARNEAWIIMTVWLIATAYSCAASYVMGYARPDRPLGADDVRAVFGVPQWFFWSVLAPWGACGVFTVVFAGFFMREDDLGRDHAAELDADIVEEASR